jgi:hypothetical protein
VFAWGPELSISPHPSLQAPVVPHPAHPVVRRPRDVRLDFFRGLCLFIIFVAHVWDNPWGAWIPARFGFSDATEIFVFCSGMASAVAFGGVFARCGYAIGTARIVYRCWQVYWAHIAIFLAVAAMMVAADRLTDGGDGYVRGLNLAPMFGEHAASTLIGMMTLTYVPHFFDILPMYLVILLMIPIVVALAEAHRVYAFAFVIGVWIAGAFGVFEIPAEPWSDRKWFFHPFAWQLIFFTGFAFMRGWLPSPPIDRRLVVLAAAVVLLSVPFAWFRLLETFDVLQRAHDALAPLIDKTRFGLLRYVHFLALAYLAYAAVGERGHRLKGAVVDVIRKVGQQSLAVFVAGLALAFFASIVLNVIGRDVVAVALVNLAGFAALVAVAYAVAWFKSAPWQAMPRPRPSVGAEAGARATQAAEPAAPPRLRLSPAE